MAGRLRLRPALRRYAHSVQRRATPGFAGPYDAIPDIVAAYGMRRLLSAYEGPILRLRRDSDQTEQDFGYTDNGDLDVAALAAWLSGANGLITTWYDQSGNGNHATQVTAAAQPLLVLSGQNGRPVVRFDGANSNLKTASAPIAAAAPITCCVVACANSWGRRIWYSGRYAYGNAPTDSARFSTVGVAHYVQAGAWGNGYLVNTVLFDASFDATFWSNGAEIGTVAGSVDGNNPLVPFTIGAAVSEFWNGDMAELVMVNAAWSTAQRQAAEQAANDYWQVY